MLHLNDNSVGFVSLKYSAHPTAPHHQPLTDPHLITQLVHAIYAAEMDI